MKSSLLDTRWDEITSIWATNRWLIGVVGWVVGILTLPAIKLIFSEADTFLSGLVPESFGILFTVLILNRLAENRANEQLKKQLQRRAGSRSNETAKAAVDELRHLGCLVGDDSLLRGFNLHDANWRNIRVYDANLCGADLSKAALIDVRAYRASFKNTNLQFSTMIRGRFDGCDFRGADLREGCLFNATFSEAIFDENTLLPDGSKWTLSEDLSRFTNIDHPGLWRSKTPFSPTHIDNHLTNLETNFRQP